MRLEISNVVSVLSFKNCQYFTISPAAKFKACPKQCVKNAFGYSDKILLETSFLIQHIFFAPS